MAIALGYLRPATTIAMKPLGDAFIRRITMIITLIIFCTVHDWHGSCHARGAGPAQSGAMRPMPG